MNITLVVLLAATALTPSKHEFIERSRTTRAIEVLLEARSVSHDPSGRHWVYHGVKGIEREPQAAGVTEIRPNGTTWTYLASDLLPAGSVYPGMVGQVYAVTPLTTKNFYAATTGWIDTNRRTRNAVVFFRRDDADHLQTYSIVEMTGIGAIAAGPSDTAVVAVNDPLKNGEHHLATILDAEGNILGSLVSFEAADFARAQDRISAVQLRQIGKSEVAILDETDSVVQAFRLFAPNACGLPKITPSSAPRTARKSSEKITFSQQQLWRASVEDRGVEGEHDFPRILDFSAGIDGAITVVRMGVLEGKPRALVSRYGHGPVRTWVSDELWRAALIDGQGVSGIVPKAEVKEERIEFDVE
ncbi:MAG TPA: hypothetical protein VF618_09730 [Thermoanaerobaculia bacterium]